MANLERRTQMSALQLALVIIMTCYGAQILLSPRELIAEAQQAAWLTCIIGGIVYYGAAYAMIKLGEQYPTDTFVEYMPKVWGSIGGSIVIWWFNIMFLLQISIILQGFTRVIAFFLFDRTPFGAIALGMMAIVVYCAVQDWGTISRLLQFLFIFETPMLFGIGMLGLLTFRTENLLPLLPNDLSAVFKAVPTTWGMYSGYEIILLLLPLVYRGKIKITKAVGGAFAALTLAFAVAMIVIVGVMTVKGAKNVPYPTIVVVRSVELPGTFLERLENYLLLAWIPAVFDTLAVMLFSVAQVCMRQYRYADHRPWVFLFVPLVNFGALLLDGMESYQLASKLSVWLGLGFSLLVVPATLAMVWWRKRALAAPQCEDA